MNVTKSIDIKGDISHIYHLWTQFENFPNFMKHIKTVRYIGPNMTHWVMEGIFGGSIEWDAITTAAEPNARVAWQSVSGDVTNSGEVLFEEAGPDLVRVTATIDFQPPGGAAGEVIAKFIGNLEDRVQEDLENFRNYASTVIASTR